MPVHGCPICFKKFPCVLDCTLVPDLTENDGTPAGAYVCCSKACAYGNDEYLYEAYGQEFEPTPYREPPPEQLALEFQTR